MIQTSLRDRFVGTLVAGFIGLSASTVLCETNPAVPPFADNLPATTAICVWSDDIRELTNHWSQTALCQVYAADAMRSFWTDVRQRRGGLLPSEQLGLPWDHLNNVAAGAWVLAYDFPSDGTGASDGAGTSLIVDVQGREAAAATALGHMQQQWRDRGMDVATRRHVWGDMVVATRDGNERWACLHGGRLYLMDRSRLAKSLSVRLDGKMEASLATTDVYGTLSAVAPSAPRGALRFFVDPWQGAHRTSGSGATKAATRMAFLERHGFRTIGPFLGHAVFHTGAHDLEFVVRLPVAFPLTDAAGLLSFMSSQDFQLSPLVPPDAVGAICFHLDIMRAFKAYGFVYDDVYGEDFTGAFDDLIGSLAHDPDGPQVDLATELFGTLSGKISRIFDYGGERKESNPTGRRELWMTKSTAPDKAAHALRKFFSDDPDVTSSSVNGVPVWHSRSGGLLLGADPENPLAFPVDALGIVHGHLVWASDRQWLRDIAGTSLATAQPLGDHSTWQASTPAAAMGQSWRDLVPVARALHECIRQQRVPSAGSWDERLVRFLISTDTLHGPELTVDGTLLPPFSAIQHQFGLEWMEARMDEQGWCLQGRITRPQP